MLGHDNLLNYMSTNFNMVKHHGYDHEAMEDMMPWEREVYVQLVINHLKEENEQMRQQANQ